jgi:hypothetical protein
MTLKEDDIKLYSAYIMSRDQLCKLIYPVHIHVTCDTSGRGRGPMQA